MQKPIVVTNFTTAKDQINHLKNGIICEMNATSLANALADLLQNEVMQKEFSTQLSKESLANRILLRHVMLKAGFKGITSEWWHFNSCSKLEAAKKFELIE